MSQKYLRKVLRIGHSKAICIPSQIAPKTEFVWLEKRGDELIIKPAEVR